MPVIALEYRTLILVGGASELIWATHHESKTRRVANNDSPNLIFFSSTHDSMTPGNLNLQIDKKRLKVNCIGPQK
jgi:hypothetical protein